MNDMKKLLLFAIAVIALVGCEKEHDKPDDPIQYIDMYGLPSNVLYVGMPKDQAESFMIASGKTVDFRMSTTTWFKLPGNDSNEKWMIVYTWNKDGEDKIRSIQYEFGSWNQYETLYDTCTGVIDRHYPIPPDSQVR